MCICIYVCVCVCVCACVLDQSRVVASRTLDSCSLDGNISDWLYKFCIDCLTGFCELLLPHYGCHF